MKFWQFCWTFITQEPVIFGLKLKIEKTKTLKMFNPFETLFWTLTMQFWQPCWIIFRKGPKIFAQIQKW